ncbi:early nodulin-related [Zea mays]|uniref:Early nodulin-related n=1 Tax=Zea mays TaxID=4577 RepID=A0A1D6LKT1_MAIZE|nr:early nodulin-related [Zea mays]
MLASWLASGCCHGPRPTSTPLARPSSSPQLLAWRTSSRRTRRSSRWRGSTRTRTRRSTSRTPPSRAPAVRTQGSSGLERETIKLPP